jgi:hypothetical protein
VAPLLKAVFMIIWLYYRVFYLIAIKKAPEGAMVFNVSLVDTVDELATPYTINQGF